MSGGGPGAAATAGAWAELLRVSALFTVPGDALAGAAASGHRLNRGTALAAASSLCLYEAGMALNDYADRHIDAVERPGRPLPSGRVDPGEALAASAVLTAAGLGLASAAGRGALLTASALAATVWAYDLGLKHTVLGPAAMAAARGLDLVLGARATAEVAEVAEVATGSRAAAGAVRASRAPGAVTVSPVARPVPDRPTAPRGRGSGARGTLRVAGDAGPGGAAGRRPSTARVLGAVGADSVRSAGHVPGLPGAGYGGPVVPATARSVRAREVLRAAGLLAAHTFAVTAVSRRETLGSSPAVPLGALGAVGLVASAVGGAFAGEDGPWAPRARTPYPGPVNTRAPGARTAWLRAVPAAAYAATGGRPLAHALFNPSPPLLQRAVGGGIRATIPLQAALAARAGRPGSGAAVLALLPAAARLSRKVSPT